MKIIFAQGNPGREYAKSRHNAGFLAVDAIGRQYGAKWNEAGKFQASIADIAIDGTKVLLVKPSSFYNETGAVARKLIDFYKLDPATEFLVIHDDLALPLGTIRIREKGGDAGNNGIKNITVHLGPNYQRIRIGIRSDRHERMGDVDFVLGRLGRKEKTLLEKHLFPRLLELVRSFVHDSLETTSFTVK